MPLFSYTAIDASSGRESRGTIDGANASSAIATLKSRGLAPLELSLASRAEGRVRRPEKRRPQNEARSPRWLAFSIGRVANAKDIALFTRQLAALLTAGMPLVRSLEVLGRQERHAGFRAVIDNLAETIRAGGSFSDGLQRHPRLFDRLYLNMVRAGEAAGALDGVLERLARFMEKAERTKGKVRSALTYPIVVMLLAVGIVAALMVFVVPRFEQIFTGMLKGQPLPALTRAVLAASTMVQHHFVWFAIGLAGVGAGFAFVRTTRPGERAIDFLAIKLPVCGDVLLKTVLARFTQTLGTLLASGVPMLDALLITRDTSGNRHVAEALAAVHDGVREGDSVASALASTNVFPPMVESMVEVGEETGALPEMLTRSAAIYEEEVDQAVAALTSLLEPLLIVFLAVVVGTIVIALFLPIVSIIKHLQ
jgi:type IV pilus assembly protein PilC